MNKKGNFELLPYKYMPFVAGYIIENMAIMFIQKDLLKLKADA